MFKEKSTPLLFLAPAIVLLVIFKLFPIGVALWESFRFTPISQESIFVGLENYEFLFRDDPVFWNSLLVTLKYNLIINPLNVVVALAFALLLNRSRPYVPFSVVCIFTLCYFFYSRCCCMGVMLILTTG